MNEAQMKDFVGEINLMKHLRAHGKKKIIRNQLEFFLIQSTD